MIEQMKMSAPTTLTTVQTELTKTDKVAKLEINQTISAMESSKEENLPDDMNMEKLEYKQKGKPYGGRPLKFPCLHCDRRFHAPSHLKRHMLCHSSERPFQCCICKKGFLQAWHLGRHMTTHTGKKPFSCPECPKTFGSRFEMKTHCNYIHRGIKEHRCTVCKKTFTLRSNLKVHMRKHTGEKPYKCDTCSKKFGQRGHLQYHLKKSPYCNKNLTSTSSKKTEFYDDSVQDTGSDSGVDVESICSDQSLQEGVDESGIRYVEVITPSPQRKVQRDLTQSDVKPFVCDFCNFGFEKISSLKAHVRHSHSKRGINAASFSCGYCHSSFDHIEFLKIHYSRKHNSVSEQDDCPIASDMKFDDVCTYDRGVNIRTPQCCKTCGDIESSDSKYPQFMRRSYQEEYLLYLDQYHDLLRSQIKFIEAMYA